MRGLVRASTALSALVFGFVITPSVEAAEPIIRNLGTIGANTKVGVGMAINASGQVAGWSWSATNVEHAFRWNGTLASGGTMVDLGTLGGTNSRGTAINASGQVAGFSKMPGSVFQYNHAFRYTGTPGSGGVRHDLGTLGGDESLGYGINASGQVVGESYTFQSANSHAFVYTGTPGAGGSMKDLGTLGGSKSSAWGINDSGQITGTSSLFNDNGARPFLYTGVPGAGGVMRNLGTLGGTNGHGYAINNAGQVAGYSLTSGNAETHAFRYVGVPGSGGVMQDLGTLPGGTASRGLAINRFGDVAGYSTTVGATVSHATLYVGTPGAGGRLIDLEAWLDATDPAAGGLWRLDYAYGISDTGLIVGQAGYNDGTGPATAAFLLDASALLPEPGCVSVVMLSMAGLLAHRSRRPSGITSTRERRPSSRSQ
jgi:probable HAF family extracellular repeat protein